LITELLYSFDENISELVEQLSFSENSCLRLTKCEEDGLFRRIINSAKSNDIIFLENSFLFWALENLLENKKITLVEKFTTDGNIYSEETASAIFKYKNTYIAVLPNDAALLSRMLEFLIFKLNFTEPYYHSACFDISDMSFEDIKATFDTFFSYEDIYFSFQKFEFFTRVHIISLGKSDTDAQILCEQICEKIKYVFGDNAYTAAHYGLANLVVNKLIEHNLKIATAESCTAGLLSSELTSVPGSSSVIEIGIATYSNRIKHAAIGVSAATLKKYGAISFQTAYEMAQGVKSLSGADLGISITGVAGPNMSENKPVGTVFAALTNGRCSWTIKLNISPNSSRDFVRKKATFMCLDLLRRFLEYYPLVLPEYSLSTSEPNYLYEIPHYNPPAENPDLFFHTDNVTPELDAKIEEYEEKPSTVEELEDYETELIVIDNTIKEAKKPLFAKEINYKAIISNSIFAILIAAIVLTSGYFATYFHFINNNSKAIEDIRNHYEYSTNVNFFGKLLCIDKLQEVNPEIVAWVEIPNTEVNNPVLLAKNNRYYRTHNHYNKYSPFGSLYFDMNCKLGYQKSNNLVIYGKNMKDTSLFGLLKNYSSLEYLRNNHSIELTTHSGKEIYNIFAVVILSDNAKDNGSDFSPAITKFDNKIEKQNWLDEVTERSLYQIAFEVPDDSEFLTLITQSDVFDGAKLAVIAYNSDIAPINNYKEHITVNHAPRYPQSWYDSHNLTNPYDDSTSAPIIPSTPIDDTSSDEFTGEAPPVSDDEIIIESTPESSQEPSTPSTPSTPTPPPSSVPSENESSSDTDSGSESNADSSNDTSENESENQEENQNGSETESTTSPN